MTGATVAEATGRLLGAGLPATSQLWEIGARSAGAALLLTGAELTVALPTVVGWRVGDGRVPAWARAATLMLTCLGAVSLAWPGVAMAGGGVVAGGLLLAIVVRFQPLGDAADMMLLLLLAGLGVRELASEQWLTRAAELFLLANICLAYWWSGYAKVRSAAWRGGRQLALAVNSPRYGTPGLAFRLLDRPRLSLALSWAVITLEMAVPFFVGLGGGLLLLWSLAALVMHVVIAHVMGLGRFLWVFMTALLCLLAARGGL